ncbi:hypothetical protein HDU86_007312 [Geranomyces michiganensis]|nr:hypothetical protein HDU86_007312 [Geranomyces michiganensis]
MVVDTAANFNIISKNCLQFLRKKAGSKLHFVHHTQDIVGNGTGGKTIGHLYLGVSPGIHGGATWTLKFSVMPDLRCAILLEILFTPIYEDDKGWDNPGKATRRGIL